jgi:hypothetical protein
MMLNDIWLGSYRGGKANYFIIINNILSLFIIAYHGLFCGFKSPITLPLLDMPGKQFDAPSANSGPLKAEVPGCPPVRRSSSGG